MRVVIATGDEEGEDPLAPFGLDAIDLTMKISPRSDFIGRATKRLAKLIELGLVEMREDSPDDCRAERCLSELKVSRT